MKILIGSITYPLPNGVTTSINNSADGFVKNGHQVVIVSPDYKTGKARAEHRPVSSSLITRGIGILIGKEERVFGINARSEIKDIIKEFKPDAYWLHTLSWNQTPFELEMNRSSKPKVLFYHTLIEEFGRIYAGKIGAYAMKERSKKACNSADLIITPTQATKKRLKSYGVTTSIKVIPTGIKAPEKKLNKKDLYQRFKLRPKLKILLYVGRISKEKNLNLLLESLQAVEDVILLMVGPGDIEEVKKSAFKMNISDRIFFTGPLPRDQVLEIYSACDLFLFPSKNETQGLAVGEAMLAGIPIVILESSITDELYTSKTTFLSKNKNHFINNIEKALLDDELRKKKRDEAKIFAANKFSQEKVLEKQIKIFEELIN